MTCRSCHVFITVFDMILVGVFNNQITDIIYYRNGKIHNMQWIIIPSAYSVLPTEKIYINKFNTTYLNITNYYVNSKFTFKPPSKIWINAFKNFEESEGHFNSTTNTIQAIFFKSNVRKLMHNFSKIKKKS